MIKSCEKDKLAQYHKITFLQTCSNGKSNTTIGFNEFFYPKNMYHKHMVLLMKLPQMHTQNCQCHLYQLICQNWHILGLWTEMESA